MTSPSSWKNVFRVTCSLLPLMVAIYVQQLPRSWQTQAQGINKVAIVSAAGYGNVVTPDSIPPAFGSQLALQTQLAAGQPLPTNLSGTSVKVNGRLSGLFFVSPFQLNFLVPADTEPGTAEVEVSVKGTVVATGTAEVKA